MRWCSRDPGPLAVAGWVCCAARGSDAGGPPAVSRAELQPASAGASKATSRADACLALARPAPFFPALTMPVSAFGNLDLPGMHRLDPRPIALLDETAHPQAQIRQPMRIEPGKDEIALITFQDRHRQRFRPAPSEIHVDGACTLADR